MDSSKASVIFHSRDRQFKWPTGPITPEEPLHLNLMIANDVAFTDVKLIVIDDRDNQKKLYPLTQMESHGVPVSDYRGFSCEFTFPGKGLYWYYFICQNGQEVFYIGKNPENNRAIITDFPTAWQQTVYSCSYQVPEWLYGGVFYHIYVDRFYHKGPDVTLPDKVIRHDWGAMPHYLPDQNGIIQNNDFFGGNLEGIIEKLPYLEDLGVTCLYLSPIFEAYSNHKYDTADYTNIDPMFGNLETFTRLCTLAGQRGIRIICDGVFSHTGSRSIYFNKDGYYDSPGAYQSADSPYRDWYCFLDNGTYESWWGIDTLPRVNKNNQDYNDFINGPDGIVARWLKAGASGWRLDVVDELPNKFMDNLAAAAKGAKSDALIIGEVWEDASHKIAYSQRKHYLLGDQLDSVMNYPFRESIIRFVRYGRAGQLGETVESIVENYPSHVVNCLMNMLGNHDTQRILTALGGRELHHDTGREEKAHIAMSPQELAKGIHRLKIATVLQMTLPGIPCVYYGDEVGIQGYQDPFNRKCFPWGEEEGPLTEWFKMVIQIRHSHPVFKEGKYRTVKAGRGVFAFERYDKDTRMLIVANCSKQEAQIQTGLSWADTLSCRVTHGNFTVFPKEVLLMEEYKD